MPVVAVGAVGIIALALLALLIVFASELLAKLVANIVSRIPLGIGDLLSGPVQGIARSVANATASAAKAVMHPMGVFFHAVWSHLVGMWDATANFASEVSVTLERLYHNTLPWVINHTVALGVHLAEAYARALVNGAEATFRLAVQEIDATIHTVERRLVAVERVLVQDVSGIESRIAAAEGQLVADVSAAKVEAINAARALAGQVRLDLTQALDAVDTTLLATIDATAHDLTDLVGNVAHDLADLASTGDAAVVAGIDAAASQVAVAAWPVVTDIVDGIKAATVPVEDVIKGAVDSIPAAVPATLAGTLAATMSLAQVGADYANECGLDLCANLGGMSNFLGQLGNDLEFGAFLALIALMVDDPQAGADAVRSTLGPLASGVAGIAREVFS